MNEEDFDSLMNSRGSRPFERDDVIRIEARAGRIARLGMALWGSTPGELERQLAASRPQIPAGFELADFRELQRWVEIFCRPQNAWLSSVPALRGPWEARRELVRRAIRYLEES